MKTQKGEQRYSSILSLTLAPEGDGWSTPPLTALPPGNRACTHCIGLHKKQGGPQGRCGELATTGIRPLDRPARSQLLHRPSYPGPNKRNVRKPATRAVILTTLQRMLGRRMRRKYKNYRKRMAMTTKGHK